MYIEAWWFENEQKNEEILQPDWFSPKTHCGVYIEHEKIEFPFRLSIQTFCKREKKFCKSLNIDNIENTEDYDIMIKNGALLIKIFALNIKGLPDFIFITIETQGQIYNE